MDTQADEIFCSKCKSRAAEEFEINKQGKQNKTCRRHSKKRSLEFDDWEEFIMLLRDWNNPVSTKHPKLAKIQDKTIKL
jgi:sarcosine oxidase delta subunit